MPRMDGLSFLRNIMSENPRPVVICSALAPRGSENALRALDEGAVDIIVKPQIGVQQFLHESAIMLADAVRGASVARVLRHGPRNVQPRTRADVRPRPIVGEPSSTIIAVGASTGGTTALRVLLEGLHADCPAIVIVQHMPRMFTGTFAQSLDRSAAVHVREAVNGDRLVRGVALIAPGDRHMRVVRSMRGGYEVELFTGPLVSRHRPSVDVLFHSVAQTAFADSIGVLLTGMGADGAEGLLAMHRAGAFTIAQDESTSIVFGMPKEAIVRGAVDRVLPLHEIAASVEAAHGLRRMPGVP
jgi:two-component system chemotaxis response regulator CheB